MDVLKFEDLWEKEAYDATGQLLGLIEAVGIGRDRVPRRVGVRAADGETPLRFFSLAGARLDGSHVVLGADGGVSPSLRLLPHVSD